MSSKKPSSLSVDTSIFSVQLSHFLQIIIFLQSCIVYWLDLILPTTGYCADRHSTGGGGGCSTPTATPLDLGKIADLNIIGSMHFGDLKPTH